MTRQLLLMKQRVILNQYKKYAMKALKVKEAGQSNVENVHRDVQSAGSGKITMFGKRAGLNRKNICKSQMRRDLLSGKGSVSC